MINIHKNIRDQLDQAIAQNKVPHAILLHGKLGHGTMAVAHHLTQSLICTGKDEICAQTVAKLEHPDLTIIFPTIRVDNKDQLCKEVVKDWRAFYLENPYAGLLDFLAFQNFETKNAVIRVSQSEEILHAANLKAYSGGNKVILIWLVNQINPETTNKLLKIIEEPPANTYFVLVAEKIDSLLPTLLSRCQTIQVPRIPQKEMEALLETQYAVNPEESFIIAKNTQGDMNKAIEYLKHTSAEFENHFVEWVRTAFRAKSDISALGEIQQWALKTSEWSKERQMAFLTYTVQTFRQALMQNYVGDELVFNQIKAEGFKWNGFAEYINGNNIELMLEEINTAIFHLERQVNSKLVLLDLSIKMTRYIHRAK